MLELNLNNHTKKIINHYSYLHYLVCNSTITTAPSTLHKNYAQTQLKSRNDNAKQSNSRHPLTTITSRLLILSHPKIASESESERSFCRIPTTTATITDRFFFMNNKPTVNQVYLVVYTRRHILLFSKHSALGSAMLLWAFSCCDLY